MTTISASVIADSFGEGSMIRLTTMHLRYPLAIHAELLTHRVFSKNSRSSRAVPTKKLIHEAEHDYAEPLHWGKAQPGMQANEELTGSARGIAIQSWHRARQNAIFEAETMLGVGLAKQNANRILAPFIHIDTLLTATEWENFFKLRIHADAEPHMRMLAEAMRDALAYSHPTVVAQGDWHLPYVEADDFDTSAAAVAEMIGRPRPVHRNDSLAWRLVEQDLKMISAARCARISYKPFEGEKSREDDIKLAVRLAKSGHWSPFEHVATPSAKNSANYRGWMQYRHELEWQNP